MERVYYYNIHYNNNYNDGDGDDGGYASDDKDDKSSDRRRVNDNESSDSDVDDDESGSSNEGRKKNVPKSPTVDEIVARYDTVYIRMHPDERLKQVVASHEHLRHWNYCPLSNTSDLPKTSHEKQWLEEHVPPTPSEPAEDTIQSTVGKSLHEKYLSHSLSQRYSHSVPKGTGISKSYGQLPAKRQSLAEIAASGTESSSKKRQWVSPVKSEVLRMLSNPYDPVMEGIRHSSMQH